MRHDATREATKAGATIPDGAPDRALSQKLFLQRFVDGRNQWGGLSIGIITLVDVGSQKTINRIFRRNGLAYELTAQGRIERLAPPVLREELASVPHTRSGT